MSAKTTRKHRQRKKQYQRRHAILRAEERCGLILNADQYRDLCSKVKNSGGKTEEAICLDKQDSRDIWAIKHEERWLPVVYDNLSDQIVTFLPLHALALDLTGQPKRIILGMIRTTYDEFADI